MNRVKVWKKWCTKAWYSQGVLVGGTGRQLVHLDAVDVHQEKRVAHRRVRPKKNLLPTNTSCIHVDNLC